ncbi:MAG TPA: DoxX family protein [Ktedonobacterales bacterium]|nr:DoxX family protein [Ktedonobacterales bacterium]
MSIAWALLIIRVIAGATLIGHGTQKAFGWFGGPGYAKLEQGFKAKGYRPVQLWTGLVILGEVGGGLSLVFGFLTPLGAAGALGAMVMAIRTHWSKGFFNSKGGFEYPLALLAMSVAVGIAGAGDFSLDQLLGTMLPSLVFFILALAALIVDTVGILMTRPSPGASQPGKARAA